MSDETDNERYARGWETLRRINGAEADKVMAALGDVAPDLGRYIVEFPYGDLMQRPGLDLRTREIVIVAALAAMGTAAPELRSHIHGALNVGVTREEIVEIMIQLTAYAGFPHAINGVMAAKEVFRERDGKGLDR
jgi:4-carboxymuconolactone decarboxylase